MKRGLITWDQERLPPPAFAIRLDAFSELMKRHDVPALVVYTDVWRSNDVRFVSNFMPYWNRAFAVVPLDEKPILLCSLSPRVYPWIKSVTIHDMIVASPSLPEKLFALAGERGWRRVGVVDFEDLPNDLYTQIGAGALAVVDIPRDQFRPVPDASEMSMHGHAAAIARQALDAEWFKSTVGRSEFHLAGDIERGVRRAGAEDMLVLVADGRGAPRPAGDRSVCAGTSVTLAVEYSGHWAKISRNIPGLTTRLSPGATTCKIESLSVDYPWRCLDAEEVREPAILSLQAELLSDSGARLFFGDTCLWNGSGTSIL